LAARLGDERTTVLFVGYQAAGTRGRALQEGARSIKIHGREIGVSARIETLDGMSAHADRGEILQWLSAARVLPRRGVHLVHGEPAAMEALSGEIRERLGLQVHVPRYLEKVEL
jgi:metallo-beta-lactamase family protein